VTNAPGWPSAGGLGRHATAHTSPVSCTVETAEREPISQTLMVLSADLKAKIKLRDLELSGEGAYPESASRPSGDTSVLNTHEV